MTLKDDIARPILPYWLGNCPQSLSLVVVEGRMTHLDSDSKRKAWTGAKNNRAATNILRLGLNMVRWRGEVTEVLPPPLLVDDWCLGRSEAIYKATGGY